MAKKKTVEQVADPNDRPTEAQETAEDVAEFDPEDPQHPVPNAENPLTNEDASEIVGDDLVADAPAEDAAVVETRATVEEAKANLASAEQAHQEALDNHEAAKRAAIPVGDPTKHWKLEGSADLIDIPPGQLPFGPNARPDRRLLVAGTNYEHVTEDEHGVWVYRRM